MIVGQLNYFHLILYCISMLLFHHCCLPVVIYIYIYIYIVKKKIALHIDGVSYKKIAKTLKLSCSMVAKTIQWFNRTGSEQASPWSTKEVECTCSASYPEVLFGK